MRFGLLDRLRRFFLRAIDVVERWARESARPVATLAAGALADRLRSPAELAVENQLLRQQLIQVRRQIRKPELRPWDRLILVFLASRTSTWASTMLIVKPETVLRWHRSGFQLFWRRKSRSKIRGPRISRETIELIRKMARNNKLWGAERIRGELLKLGIRHAKSTIQRYIWQVRGPRDGGQSWRTFLRNHARHIWACDFLQTYDVFFRPIFAFLIIELETRALVHVAVTRHPTSEWTVQQLRNATAWSMGPRFLIRDRDSKYGPEFDRAAEGVGIRCIQTPYRAPNANAFCERLVGSVRRECLDHVIVLGERHMDSVLKEYRRYYNRSRPHQGTGQRVPRGQRPYKSGNRVVELPTLGGLHHEYRLAA